jgi:hypothetical protein
MPSTALAAKPALRLTVTPSAKGLTVRVATKPKSTCALKVTARGQRMTLPKVRTTAKGRAVFTWAVPTDAPSGRWTFTVRCTKPRSTDRRRGSA